jgi:hypothetical protein
MADERAGWQLVELAVIFHKFAWTEEQLRIRDAKSAIMRESARGCEQQSEAK